MFLLLSISSAARADAPPGTARAFCCASVGAAANVFNELSPEEHAIASARLGVVSGACAHNPRRVLQPGHRNATLMPPRRSWAWRRNEIPSSPCASHSAARRERRGCSAGNRRAAGELGSFGLPLFLERARASRRRQGRPCARRRPLRQDYQPPANRNHLTSPVDVHRSLDRLAGGVRQLSDRDGAANNHGAHDSGDLEHVLGATPSEPQYDNAQSRSPDSAAPRVKRTELQWKIGKPNDGRCLIKGVENRSRRTEGTGAAGVRLKFWN